MYLKALEIQGFKSFPDKTRVAFDEGITAVVGPNGSGKSNISDAIRWVMGETSVKQLRGGGKMEDVIFGGTQKRNAMGYASVHLILDNADRRIDVQADEVVIGRKYYRSGDSEYSVNGQSVRLRDVYEMLLDTGLGRDGYSVIGQGRINEIVDNKSTERREIFEEASGIARFRYQKKDAEKQLSSAEDNLVRLRDILGELQDRVGPLEKESKKAKKFLEYSADKKAHEVTLWVDTVHSTRENLRNQQRKIEIIEADYAAKGREISAIEDETEDIQNEINRAMLMIEQQNEAIVRVQEEIAEGETKVAILNHTIERNKKDADEMRMEVEKSGDTTGEMESEIALQTADIERAEKALEGANEKIGALENEIAEIQKKSLEGGRRRDILQAHLAEMTDGITALKVTQAAAASTSQSAQARLSEQSDILQNLQTDLEERQTQKEDIQSFLDDTMETLTRLENIKGGLEMKLAARQKALSEADTEERDVVRKAENAQQRIAMLQDLERSLDGFSHSVKEVVKAGRAGKLRGVIGPVSTILSVQSGYEVALETALGFGMQNIVVNSQSDAKAAMAFLKQTNGGRATFLPLDTVQPRRMDASRLPHGAISAQKLVKYDAKYENVASSLLANIVVVEDINEASHVAKQLAYRNRVVTRDGQVINAGGSFTGGSVSRTVGLFSRKQEIEELAAKLVQLQGKKDAAMEQTDKIKAEVDAISAELVATNSEAVVAGGDKIRCETELVKIEQSLAELKNREKMIAQDEEALKEQIAKASAEHKLSTAEQESLTRKIDAMTKELLSIAGEDDGFLATRERLNQELGSLRLAALGHKNDAQLHRQRIETLKSQTGENLARTEVLKANISRLLSENQSNENDIIALQEGKEKLKEEVAKAQADIESLRAARMEKESSIKDQTTRERTIRDEREALGREIGTLTEQKNTIESRYDTTMSQLWEEYELTLPEAEAICIEFTTAADLNRRVRELRGKIRALGNVNVGAIEEYAEVSERYTFLTAQVGDVEASKLSLEKMIAELSAEMTAMFSQSFIEINRNFARIFTELFGGGTANLSLANPEDVLESGIDIEVAPPGKIIKNLAALSGGERALVAICIYFAILGVNPAPFCVLDEIEAALDDSNVVRFAQYLRRVSDNTQFIVITHRRGSMEEADVLYGVTMQEDGVSKLLRLQVGDVDPSLVQ